MLPISWLRNDALQARERLDAREGAQAVRPAAAAEENLGWARNVGLVLGAGRADALLLDWLLRWAVRIELILGCAGSELLREGH